MSAKHSAAPQPACALIVSRGAEARVVDVLAIKSTEVAPLVLVVRLTRRHARFFVTVRFALFHALRRQRLAIDVVVKQLAHTGVVA